MVVNRQGKLKPDRPTPGVMGARIKEAREAKGWSQAKLGEEVGTSQQTIEKIEAGRIKRTSYLTDILAVLGLPYERNVSIARSPVFTRFGRIPVGSHLTARREALGLEPTELAKMAEMDTETLADLESLTEEPSPLSVNGVLARRILDVLVPLERNDPYGEPYAHPGYYMAALPSGEMDFPYFRMGEEKGIQFEYFGPSPWDLPRLRGFFCLTVASWINGAFIGRPIKAGAKIYAKPFRVFRSEEPISVIAHRVGERPENVHEIYVGTLVAQTETEITLSFRENREGPGLVLQRKDWNLAQIYFAALTDLAAVYRAAVSDVKKSDDDT